jgi:hypothetical protein
VIICAIFLRENQQKIIHLLDRFNHLFGQISYRTISSCMGQPCSQQKSNKGVDAPTPRAHLGLFGGKREQTKNNSRHVEKPFYLALMMRKSMITRVSWIYRNITPSARSRGGTGRYTGQTPPPTSDGCTHDPSLTGPIRGNSRCVMSALRKRDTPLPRSCFWGELEHGS